MENKLKCNMKIEYHCFVYRDEKTFSLMHTREMQELSRVNKIIYSLSVEKTYSFVYTEARLSKDGLTKYHCTKKNQPPKRMHTRNARKSKV